MTARARRAWVEERVRARCFTAPQSDRSGGPLFGAEIELLVMESATGRPASLSAPHGPSALAAARAAASRLGWRDEASHASGARFAGPRGAALTFEPGGQIEYASATHRALHALHDELRTVSSALHAAALDVGVTLVACGVDPENGAERAALQLGTERYRRMDAHFARIGPAGARMMRQTASLQLCVGGIDVVARWPVANAIAPWLVALFANSPRYAGRDTACASYRAETWREVDRSRTGVFSGGDPVSEYSRFALEAGAILCGPEAMPAVRLADVPDEALDERTLLEHLSTLFPEVRPRGYLELRSADAVESGRYAGALVLAAGLLADAESAAAVAALLTADAELLRTAGRAGMGDPTIARYAGDLCALALEGCARLGPRIVRPALLELARDELSCCLASVGAPAMS